MSLFRSIERILTSRANRLEELADVVDLPVEELFLGESFVGIDLRDEPIAVLMRINADYRGAILTPDQKRALKGVRASRERRERAESITAMRRSRMETYIDKHIKADRRIMAHAALVEPLLAERPASDRRARAELGYAAEALKFVLQQRQWLLSDAPEAVLDLLLQIKAMRLPVNNTVLRYLSAGVVTLNPGTVRLAFNLDLCSDSFVFGWLDGLRGSEANRNPDRAPAGAEQEPQALNHTTGKADAYGDGLRLAIEGRSRASGSYLAGVLRRARSHDELMELVRAVERSLIDQDVASELARMLARTAHSSRDIESTILDEMIDRRILAVFRRLVAAAGTQEGRQALLRVVSRAARQASGIELDTILSDVDFDAGVRLMEPHWASLSLHHRRVAIECLARQATDARRARRVAILRSTYLTQQ